jgi:hypothetical protein
MGSIKYYVAFISISIVACLTMSSFKIVNASREEPALFKQSTFYIAEMRDLRAVKGTESAILIKFIADNLPKNRALKPIVIDIKELTVTENAGKTGMVEGVIKIALSFSLQKEEANQHLLNYNGGMRYTRSATNKTVVEQYLKQLDQSALLYFNKWMNNNISSSKMFARAVKFHFKDFAEEIEGDTLYYSASRPLNWSDFNSKTRRSNKYAAMVMPNFGYDQEEKIENGIIHVNITLKTFLAKNDCWLGSSYKDDYMLNHEQRHFDIAKIVTEQFKEKLAQASVNPDTYEALINMQYLDSYRDMNKLQKDYDGETSHGLNSSAQQSWNRRIDGLLAGNKSTANLP